MPEPIFIRLPVDAPITGGFGDWYGSYQHRGIDFGCPVGTPVYAPAAGRSVPFTNDGSFGNAVCLDHEGTPWFTLYAHLDAVVVSVGQLVSAGDLLGYSGNTGRTTGPHLHWQCCRSAAFPLDITQSTDPLSFYQPGGDENMPDPRISDAELQHIRDGVAQAYALNAAAMSSIGSFVDFQTRMLSVEQAIRELQQQVQVLVARG